jgi:hypothetical protein
MTDTDDDHDDRDDDRPRDSGTALNQTFGFSINGDRYTIRRRYDASEVKANSLLAKAGIMRHAAFDLYRADPDADTDDQDGHFQSLSTVGDPIERVDLREHDEFVAVSRSEQKQAENR